MTNLTSDRPDRAWDAVHANRIRRVLLTRRGVLIGVGALIAAGVGMWVAMHGRDWADIWLPNLTVGLLVLLAGSMIVDRVLDRERDRADRELRHPMRNLAGERLGRAMISWRTSVLAWVHLGPGGLQWHPTERLTEEWLTHFLDVIRVYEGRGARENYVRAGKGFGQFQTDVEEVRHRYLAFLDPLEIALLEAVSGDLKTASKELAIYYHLHYDNVESDMSGLDLSDFDEILFIECSLATSHLPRLSGLVDELTDGELAAAERVWQEHSGLPATTVRSP